MSGERGENEKVRLREEDWKDGMVEDWNDGRMEKWNNEIMECWNVGREPIIKLNFNIKTENLDMSFKR